MLIDTILSQRFRSELPASLAFGLGALCALAVAAAALARRIGAAVLVAALAFLLSLGSSALLALSAGMYLNPVAPAGAALVALAAATAARPRSRASRSGS
jgi:CHASE2 domain-containing sensor protein